MQPGKESGTWESLASLKAQFYLLAYLTTKLEKVGKGSQETLFKAEGEQEEFSLLLRQCPSPSAWIPLSETASAPPDISQTRWQAQVSSWRPSLCRKC